MGAVGLAACKKTGIVSDPQIVTMDTYDQITAAPNGLVCALNPYLRWGNEIIVLTDDLLQGRLFVFPDSSASVKPGGFSDDGQILLVAISDPSQERISKIGRLDLRSGSFLSIENQSDYSVAPHYARDGAMHYFGRSEGAAFLTLKSNRTRLPEDLDDTAFQSVKYAETAGATTFVRGVRGSDPFDSLRIDQSTNFSRFHLVGAVDDYGFAEAFAISNASCAFHGLIRTDTVVMTVGRASDVALVPRSGSVIRRHYQNVTGVAPARDGSTLFMLEAVFIEGVDIPEKFISVGSTRRSIREAYDSAIKTEVI